MQWLMIPISVKNSDTVYCYGQLQSPDNVPDSIIHLNGTELELRGSRTS